MKTEIPGLLKRSVVVVLVAALAGLAGQQAGKPAPPAVSLADVDVDDLIQECQQTLRGKEYAGIVWWVPVEFWEISALSQGTSAPVARAQFDALREYTLVGLAVGKMGAFGGITWTPGGELRARSILRDAAGNDYRPVEKLNPDAQMLSTLLRPMLASLLGQIGQNIEFIFFPSRNKKGEPLVDPRSAGNFSVILKDIVGSGERAYEWRTPLTSLLPPKFCPTGNEKIQANWKFCPWHGTKLE
jgi:hypothetical protein